jgi:hypothetical protein
VNDSRRPLAKTLAPRAAFSPAKLVPICEVFFSLLFVGCSFIGANRSVEVVLSTSEIVNVDLTPRHYRALEHCQTAVSSIPHSLFASLTPLTPDQRARLTWPAQLAKVTAQDCNSFQKRGDILDIFDGLFSSKSPRIGIILPPTSENEAALDLIIAQMRKDLLTEGFHANDTLIIRRVEKNKTDALKAAAELVHMDRVSLLIGGLHPSHAQAIVQMADQSQTPALIVSANAPLGRTKQTMRVYPPLKRLALRLTTALQEKDVHDVVAFYPNNGNLALFNLMKQLNGPRLNYSQASYNPADPASILSAIKGQTAKIAAAHGRPAVLIFDNFRMVRHIVNITTTALPTSNILFAGNQQWRSPALVVPRDEALQGALFVDFIGNYRNLPDTLETPISDSEYFTTAEAASRLDYQVIGHRLGSLAAEAARWGTNRHEIANRLQGLKNKWDTYFPTSELAFDNQRESSWPVFLFGVTDNTIKEL